jgi:hypothetical protein
VTACLTSCRCRGYATMPLSRLRDHAAESARFRRSASVITAGSAQTFALPHRHAAECAEAYLGVHCADRSIKSTVRRPDGSSAVRRCPGGTGYRSKYSCFASTGRGHDPRLPCVLGPPLNGAIAPPPVGSHGNSTSAEYSMPTRKRTKSSSRCGATPGTSRVYLAVALFGVIVFVCGLVLMIAGAGGHAGVIGVCAGGAIGAGARGLSWSSRD